MWLLFSVGAGVVCGIAWLWTYGSKSFKVPCGVLAAIAGLVAVLSLWIGIIRFVKWTWGD